MAGTEYSMKPDERADVRSLDRRFDDIALRLRKMEARGDTIGDLEKQLVTLALTRINDVLGPAYEQIEGKAHLGALLATTAEQELGLPFAGQASFLVAIADRNTFAPAGFLSFVSTAEPTAIMLGSFVSYDPDTGVLVVNITNSTGPAGPHTNWAVAIAQPPEIGYSYSQAEVDALIAAAIGNLVNSAGLDLDTLGESAARIEGAEAAIIALDAAKAPKASPALVTPSLWNSGNVADWQEAAQLVRGDGTGKRYRLDTLGDAANGVVNLAVVDVTTGERLIEIAPDGYVNALAGFKANGIALPRILGAYHENPSFSVTRTGDTWSYYYPFADIVPHSATSSLIVNMAVMVASGDGTSRFATGYSALTYDNSSDVASSLSLDLAGLLLATANGPLVTYIRSRATHSGVLSGAAMRNSTGVWRVAIGTQCGLIGIDVTWSAPTLFALEIEGGDIG